MENNEVIQGVKMARPVRFERTTTGFVVRRSILTNCFSTTFNSSKSSKINVIDQLRVLPRITAPASEQPLFLVERIT